MQKLITEFAAICQCFTLTPLTNAMLKGRINNLVNVVGIRRKLIPVTEVLLGFLLLTFIGRTVQRLYQRMYFSLAERYNVCTAASYLC
jgi:hypothetical protein